MKPFEEIEEEIQVSTHVNNNAFIQQTLLLRSHDKVVCVVLVVHNILQVNPCLKKERKEIYFVCSEIYNGLIVLV